MADWTPPPPGDRREQLPDDVLALIDIPPYTSTACETAAACEDGYQRNTHWIGLLQRAEQLHQRCRLNNKFTGAICRCPCHQPPP